VKRISERTAWAIALLLIGIFLLLKNLGVFGPLGDAIWGGFFAAVGLGFLIWFAAGSDRWWRAIAGFSLLSIGVLILLGWRGITLGNWAGSVVMFGVALGFWAVVLVHPDNWWAVIPAGVLTVVGLLAGLQGQISREAWLAAFMVGLGLVFVLVYVLRFGQHDTRWAAIPAVALILLGVVTWINSVSTKSGLLQWWPLLLAIGGLALLIGRRGRGPAAAPAPDVSTIPAANGTSVTQDLPAIVPAPASASPVADASPGAPDIYAVLAQQPPEPAPTPPADDATPQS
jgi:hypothetical protein